MHRGPLDSLAVSHINIDVDRRFSDEVRGSIRARLHTLEIAEKLLARREQLVSVRERAIPAAIASSSGFSRNFEAEVDEAVMAAAARLPEPVFVAGFVSELEDRAVEVECSQRLVRQKLSELRRWEASVQAKASDVEVVMERARLLDQSARDMLAQLRKKEMDLNEAAAKLESLRSARPLSTSRAELPTAAALASITRRDSASQTDEDPRPISNKNHDADQLDHDSGADEYRQGLEDLAGREERFAIALKQHELEVGCFRQQQLWFLPRLEALQELEGRLRSFGLMAD